MLDAAAIRAAAESSPRLRSFVRTVAAHSEAGDRRATALLDFLVRRVVDDIGQLHIGDSLLRLERIDVLRDNIAAILDHVLDDGKLPPGVSVDLLGKHFDNLTTEMRELTRPRDQIVGDQPLRIYDDAADYAGTVLREFEGAQSPGGRHVEPAAAMQDAFRALPAQRQTALRRAMELEPKALLRTVASETEPGQVKALAALEADLGGRLSAAELADVRAAIADLGRARSRGLQVSEVRLGEALARIADPELQAVVAASGDVWIVQQLAMHNPQGLATLWDQYRAKGRSATDASGFRAYLRHEMVTFGRAVPAEYTAAFSLTSIELFLKGPDANPRAGGTDLVGIGKTGWVWLVDDKSHRAKSVSSVTALVENLVPNLRDDAAQFRAAIERLKQEDPGFTADPKVLDAIQRMEQAATKIEDIQRSMPPAAQPALIREALQDHKLRLRVTSAMGEVADVSEALEALGLAFKRTRAPVPLPPRPGGGG